MLDNFVQHKKVRKVKKERTEFRCGRCPLVFKTKNEYNKHRESIHVPKKVLECPHCDYTCKQSTNLKTHMSRVHR